MRVNNRKCINRIAGRCLFANKRRNIITIAAIILTAVLFTSLFTIMLSINASYETSIFRQLGGYAHGTFKDVTNAQEDKLISHPYISAYGERMILGEIAEEPFNNQSAEISYMDENTARWSYIELEAGHLPEAKNEIAMDTEALKLLGYRPVLGEQIDLSFNMLGSNVDEQVCSDTFTLVGYWQFDMLSPAHFINVSREYADFFSARAEVLGLDPIRTDIDVMLHSSIAASDQMTAVIEDSGFTAGDSSSDESIRFGVNPGYTTSVLEGGDALEFILPMAAFLLLVIFTGYLIIYNVFQISVATDIRFYGLLKTIGTTGKQLKRMIRIQALVLCAIGIPAGLLLGYMVGANLTPAVLNTTTYGGNSVTVTSSPVVFIASAFFELITVLISVSKPGRMAGKVSPMEALRFNDGGFSGRKKKATKGARVTQMAVANIERNRKKTVIVFVSLALSLVLLNTVYMLVGGFDSEKWLSTSTSADFIVGKTPYFKFQMAGQNSITEDEISLIKENVEAVNDGTAYVLNEVPLIKLNDKGYRWYQENQPGMLSDLFSYNGSYYMDNFMEGMDNALIDKVTVYEGDISLLKDKSKRYIALITHRDENGSYTIDENAPGIGDTVTLGMSESIEFIDTRTGTPATDPDINASEYLSAECTGMSEYEYTVCAYVYVPVDISLRSSSFGYDGIISSDHMKEDFGDSTVPLFYAFDTGSDDAEADAESFLEKLSNENNGITYESKAVRRSEFDSFKRMFTLLGGMLCLIIGAVGLLNFFNTIMAGILARKNEIAVLQAIGMTGKQVKTMLMTEGMIYSFGSGLIALVISLLFVPVVNAVAYDVFWFYSKHISVTPVLLVLPLMALIGICVPLISYINISKASIIDRIREIGQ
ncbi:MAG: ABC transporter permease [Lachnospiraceae bacterium]|nr:ABC transporter permease [Lachnospiraceae bacterium]